MAGAMDLWEGGGGRSGFALRLSLPGWHAHSQAWPCQGLLGLWSRRREAKPTGHAESLTFTAFAVAL